MANCPDIVLIRKIPETCVKFQFKTWKLSLSIMKFYGRFLGFLW